MDEFADTTSRTASTSSKVCMGYTQMVAPQFRIAFNTSKNCKVNVLDKASGQWLLRLDKAHRGTPYNHININPTVTKLPGDPHLKLPPGGVTVGKTAAKLGKTINKANKVLVPVAIAMDTVTLGLAVREDVKNGTSRNSVSTAVGIAGGFGGAYGGAAAGAALGSLMCPGVGTIIGGLVGSVVGGVGGSVGLEAVTNAIGDEVGWDVEKRKCKSCGKLFKIRKYEGEKDTYLCERCR
ncbi:hypothetical protein FBUS_11003 [Fasciolopsis buskii]|uniref:Uncharacterized protein n=1 Tax=Fasciolopsis buskii TaxID=27845 RepID=A0A8E0RWT0_9TREM|nr:hypothetical protein FBUS_11003 [Fasciolopsis buski]